MIANIHARAALDVEDIADFVLLDESIEAWGQYLVRGRLRGRAGSLCKSLRFACEVRRLPPVVAEAPALRGPHAYSLGPANPRNPRDHRAIEGGREEGIIIIKKPDDTSRNTGMLKSSMGSFEYRS